MVFPKALRWLQRKRTCTDCGFLAYGGAEMDREGRIMLDTRGQAGMFSDVGKVHCFKNEWTWGLHYVEPNWEAVFGELDEDRRDCEGFRRYRSGRSPEAHVAIEDIHGQRRFQALLGLLSFGGALLGALIGRACK